MAASEEVRRLSFTLEMAMAPRLGLEVSPALGAFSELLILPFAAMQSVVEDKLGAKAALERLDAGLGDPELPEQVVVLAVHQLQFGLAVEELVHSRVVQLGQPLAWRASSPADRQPARTARVDRQPMAALRSLCWNPSGASHLEPAPMARGFGHGLAGRPLPPRLSPL
jgi:hypothetical protein